MSAEHGRDRQDLRTRAGIIVPLAREMLTGSSFFEDKRRFSLNDEEAAMELMLASAPYSHPNTFPDFPRHSLTVALYLKRAAGKIGLHGFAPHEAFCIGLLHDWPPVAPHRYLRKNIAANLILGEDNIGIRSGVLDKFPEILSILGMKGYAGKSFSDFLKRGDIQILGDSMDVIGRVSPDGKVKDPHEFLRELEKKSRGTSDYLKNAIWPSEKKGLHAMYSEKTNKSRFAINLVKAELLYLKWIKGLNLNILRKRIEKEYNLPENQRWILDFLNTQETLDPQVDRKLGRKPVDTVIFDAGGVLLNVRDEELIEKISQRLGAEKEKVLEAFDKLNPKAVAGEITPEKYLEEFAGITGKKGVAATDFIFPEIYKPVEGMQEIVGQLKQKGVGIWVYSNIIPLLTGVAGEKLSEFYPEIDRQKILYSCGIKAAKQNTDSFASVADRVGGEVLFIDDSEKYALNARVSGRMRGFTFRGNPYRKISPRERLLSELQLAGLI